MHAGAHQRLHQILLANNGFLRVVVESSFKGALFGSGLKVSHFLGVVYRETKLWGIPLKTQTSNFYGDPRKKNRPRPPTLRGSPKKNRPRSGSKPGKRFTTPLSSRRWPSTDLNDRVFSRVLHHCTAAQLVVCLWVCPTTTIPRGTLVPCKL